jgi:hypothetical protein
MFPSFAQRDDLLKDLRWEMAQSFAIISGLEVVLRFLVHSCPERGRMRQLLVPRTHVRPSFSLEREPR